MKNGHWMKEWKQCLNDITKHIILLLPHGTTNIITDYKAQIIILFNYM